MVDICTCNDWSLQECISSSVHRHYSCSTRSPSLCCGCNRRTDQGITSLSLIMYHSVPPAADSNAAVLEDEEEGEDYRLG